MGVRACAVPYRADLFDFVRDDWLSADIDRLRATLRQHHPDAEVEEDLDLSGLRLTAFMAHCVPANPPLFEFPRDGAWRNLPPCPTWDGPEGERLFLLAGDARASLRATAKPELAAWLDTIPDALGIACTVGDLPWPWPPAVAEPVPDQGLQDALAKRVPQVWVDLCYEHTLADGRTLFTSTPSDQVAYAFTAKDASPPGQPVHVAYATRRGTSHREPPEPGALARLRRWWAGTSNQVSATRPGRCTRSACSLCDAAEFASEHLRHQ